MLTVHTDHHHFGWDNPTANEIRYMVMHLDPDREFAEWAKSKQLRWSGLDCGSADHPMNTIIRDWIPRQARQAKRVFQKKFGMPHAEDFDASKHQLMHLELFPYGIMHAECLGGETDLLVIRRVTVGMFPWRFVDGEFSIVRCVAMVEVTEHKKLIVKKASLPRRSSAMPSSGTC